MKNLSRSTKSDDAKPEVMRVFSIQLPTNVSDWVEHYRRFWEQSFDRLGDYLHELQKKEKKHGRKKS